MLRVGKLGNLQCCSVISSSSIKLKHAYHMHHCSLECRVYDVWQRYGIAVQDGEMLVLLMAGRKLQQSDVLCHKSLWVFVSEFTQRKQRPLAAVLLCNGMLRRGLILI